MKIGEKIRADIVAAMKAHDEHRLTTLRGGEVGAGDQEDRNA
jgi:uncharacterized protein YqeY